MHACVWINERLFLNNTMVVIISWWGNAWVNWNCIDFLMQTYWEYDEWITSTTRIVELADVFFNRIQIHSSIFTFKWTSSSSDHSFLFRLFKKSGFSTFFLSFRCTFLFQCIENLYSGCGYYVPLVNCVFHMLFWLQVDHRAYMRYLSVFKNTHVLVLKQLVSCNVIWSLRSVARSLSFSLACSLSFTLFVRSFSCDAFKFVLFFFYFTLVFVCSLSIFLLRSRLFCSWAESRKPNVLT